MVAKGKARGLARDLIKECESQPWPHIKEQLHNCLNNASKHTYTSRFMEIQQKDSETLTAYIHRFKKEAKHCNFNSHPAKIRIFLKGLINSSKIAPGVNKKGPTTIEDAIGIVEKISSVLRIAASFSQNHQISMMKRGLTNHHTPNQDCSNCGQLGHPWFTCLHKMDMMTGEAAADLMLGFIQETEAQAAQDTPVQIDTPAGTETLDGGTCWPATELKANHPTGSNQVAIDH